MMLEHFFVLRSTGRSDVPKSSQYATLRLQSNYSALSRNSNCPGHEADNFPKSETTDVAFLAKLMTSRCQLVSQYVLIFPVGMKSQKAMSARCQVQMIAKRASSLDNQKPACLTDWQAALLSRLRRTDLSPVKSRSEGWNKELHFELDLDTKEERHHRGKTRYEVCLLCFSHPHSDSFIIQSQGRCKVGTFVFLVSIIRRLIPSSQKKDPNLFLKTMTMKLLLNRTTVARVARPMVRPSVAASISSQSRAFHSSLDNQTMMRADSTSSLRDPDIDPHNWGYRVVVPSYNGRAYSTSGVSSFSTREDYDEYTLHTAPSENTHCDLGTIPNVPPGEVDTLLQYDEAGFVRPVWETITSANDEPVAPSLGDDEWAMNSHLGQTFRYEEPSTETGAPSDQEAL